MFCYVMSPVSSLIGRKCFITQRQTGRWNSRSNIHTLNRRRTCTLQNICLRHMLYTCVNFFVCRMLHHILWSFSMTKDEAALLRSVVTQPFGPRHCLQYLQNQTKVPLLQHRSPLPQPLLYTTYSNPSGASFVGCKGISWTLHLARAVHSTQCYRHHDSCCANISSWMGDQISSFRLCLQKEFPANSVCNWQFRRIGPNILINPTSSAQFQIYPENSTGHYFRSCWDSN
jgi:hypothetical protein